jgi:hypothetical protein
MTLEVGSAYYYSSLNVITLDQCQPDKISKIMIIADSTFCLHKSVYSDVSLRQFDDNIISDYIKKNFKLFLSE